jgi:predicted transposase/invertase (TIGR01784 family)
MAKRYLDPKNDLVFKRIFGEHPHILRSFLNALLPLSDEEQIVSLEYLPAEQVPQIPTRKNSIVDVRCMDKNGRQFIVEMQMNWTSAFMQRMLFNASKAYVRQLDKSENYALLQPVIGLSLLDDIFDKKTAEFYHHYQIVNLQQPERIIEGLQLVFIELPKFKPAELKEDHKQSWIRFLQEIDSEETMQQLCKQVPEIAEAYELAIESAYSPAELETYDRYWDTIRTERTLIEESKAESRAEGKIEGASEERAKIRAHMAAKGMSAKEIDDMLGGA